MIAHNGEINTLRGNVNWMRARESQLASELFGDDLQKVLPVVRPGGSDSATFDNVLELLVLAGRSLPHAVMMMIPEAYEDRDDLPEDLKGFYAFHSCLMEPWDGPAAVAFTDGRVIGATLDRNGLRPGRWLETEDGWVVLGSESGVMDEAPANVKRKGRLQPGKLFLVDLERGVIVDDGEVKREVAGAQPYSQWFEEGIVHLADLPAGPPQEAPKEPLHDAPARVRLHAGGPARPARADRGQGRGADRLDGQRRRAGRAQRPRAAAVQLLQAALRAGHEPADRPDPRGDRDEHGHGRRLRAQPARRRRPSTRTSSRCTTPILFDRELQSLRHVDSSVFKARTVDITWPVAEGPDGMVAALERACARGRRGARRRRQHPDPLRPRGQPRAGGDPVAARGRRACTTTSCARARACRPGSCSSPASRARSTTSRR